MTSVGMYLFVISVLYTLVCSSKETINVVWLSPNSIMPTLRLSLKLPRGESRGHKSWKSATQITSPTFIICVADFLDLCPLQSLRTLLPTLLPTFLVHSNGLNSIRATQMGLSQTCHGRCCKHLDMLRLFVSATFMICVHDFPHGEVSVGVMEFGLYAAILIDH